VCCFSVIGANRATETESFRRDLEQREAILRATNKQLQDSLQRQMNESNMREERMREELTETRRRWQEAITSREALASEVGGATTPLLRQITALQETLRVKTDNWQKVLRCSC
jgi:TATA element modulatory factor